MESRVLSFPSAGGNARHSAKRLNPVAEIAADLDVFGVGVESAAPGPQLVYSRPAGFRAAFGPRAQAQWIAQQIDREIARRIERETAERHRMCGKLMPYAGPMQATDLTLRHRLLDALLCFGRPA